MLFLPEVLEPIELLLQMIITKYLLSSYCITVITENNLNIFPNSFMYILPNDTDTDTLTSFMLNASEMGCSDYIIQINEPATFIRAFENVVRLGNVRKGNRKIIMLPTQFDVTNTTEKLINVLSMKESRFIADLLLITPSTQICLCEIYDVVTHKFVGVDDNDKPIYLDRWNSCTKKFENNVNLFPHDMSNLEGKTVVVTGFTYKPYILLDLDPNIVPNGRDGLDIRIIEEFCRWINCTIELIGDDGLQWGEIYDNMTGSGVLGNVFEDRADLGITALYPWYEEFNVMDFSASYVRTGVTCIVPSPRLLASWQMPLLPFSIYMWIGLFFTFVYACLALIIAKGFSTDEAVLTTFGIMVTQSRPESGFSSWRIRSVVGWMLLTGLVLDNAYGGGLASTFTVPRYESSIDTIEDIVDRNLIWGATHEAWTFSLLPSQEPLLKKLVKLFQMYSFEELERKSFTRSMAFSIEKLPGGTYAIGEYITKKASADFTIMLEEFYFEHCIVMTRKSSIFTSKLSDLVGRLHQSGLLLAWETQIALKYLDYEVQLEVKLSRSKRDVENIEPLALRHVEGIFIIYSIGALMSIITFASEVIIYKKKLKKNQRNTSQLSL